MQGSRGEREACKAAEQRGKQGSRPLKQGRAGCTGEDAAKQRDSVGRIGRLMQGQSKGRES
jgi:hypothetical protein